MKGMALVPWFRGPGGQKWRLGLQRQSPSACILWLVAQGEFEGQVQATMAPDKGTLSLRTLSFGNLRESSE